MPNLRSKLIRLAHSKPKLRGHLLPLLKSAMEHSTEEELKTYLKDHPNADPKNHTVKKTDKPSGGGKPGENAKGGKVKKNDDGSFNVELPKEFDDEMYQATRSRDTKGQEESLNKMYNWVSKKTGIPRNKVEKEFHWDQEDLGEPITLRPK